MWLAVASAWAVTITSPSSVTGTYGSAFSYQITATSPIVTVNTSQLPPGLTFDNVNFVISGKPTALGSFSVGLNVITTMGIAAMSVQIDIGKATIRLGGITANKVYDGNATATFDFTNLFLDGLVAGDAVGAQVGSYTASYPGKGVGNNLTITATGFSLTGPDVAKYTLVTDNLTGNITQKTVTISGLMGVNKTYTGSTDAVLDKSGVNLVGVVPGSAVTLNAQPAVGTYDTPDVGLAKPVTTSGWLLQGTDAGNYSLTFPATTADITPQPITVKADAVSKVEGEIDPPLSFTTPSPSGLLNGDRLTGSLVRVPGEAHGTYAILLGSLTAGANYALQYTGANLTIIDNGSPTLMAVNMPPAGLYKAGDTFDFTVQTSETVLVTGTPRLPFKAGSATVYADYLSGSGSSTLKFRHTVAAGESEPDIIMAGAQLDFNGGSIRDYSGNDVDPAMGTVIYTGAVRIDGVLPAAVSIVRLNPNLAETILTAVTYRVTFNKPITGLDALDFNIVANGGVIVTLGEPTLVAGGYDLAVTGISGVGTIRLDLKASGTGIVDTVGNPIAGGFQGEVYTIVGNRAPSFTVSGDAAAAADAGPQTLSGWVSNLNPGAPDEAGQTLTFTATADQPELFTAAPAVLPNGDITFTPNPSSSGEALVTLVLKDNGGTAHGGHDTSEPVSFKIKVTTFATQIGTYVGLVQNTPLTGPTSDRTGTFRLTISKTGLFTGTLKMVGGTHPLKGRIDQGGTAHFGRGDQTILPLKLKNGQQHDLSVGVDVIRGTDRIEGYLYTTGSAFALIQGGRCVYSAKKNPVAPLRKVPAELLGKYTVVFSPKSVADQGLLADQFPQGAGCGLLTVSANGTVKLDALLADGTRVVAANPLIPNPVSGFDEWPLYVPLASGQGSLSAFVTFRDVAATSDLDALNVPWFKPAKAKAKYYPAGWADGIRTDLIGSKLIIPKGLPVVSILPGLAATDLDGNAGVTFTEGGLSSGGLPKAVNIDPKNKVQVIAPDVDHLALSLSGAQGRFSGSFVLPSSGKKASYRGVILQKQQVGGGFFLGTDQSGAVVVRPQ